MRFVNKGPRLEGRSHVPHGETLADSLREKEKEVQRADQLVRGPTGLQASVQPRRTSCVGGAGTAGAGPPFRRAPLTTQIGSRSNQPLDQRPGSPCHKGAPGEL